MAAGTARAMVKETALSRDLQATPAAGSAPSANTLSGLLKKGRPLVMGVLNVTPDSFSDGGRFLDPQAAIAQAKRLAGEGADILDIGAESSRPYGNAIAVPVDEEHARLAPILPAVVALGVPVSIDTMKAAVAAWALETGAAIVNDVWGLQRDPDMARVVAEHRVPVIVMHNRDKADPSIDIVADVRRSSPARSTSPPAPALRGSASCSIPASASARRRSRA